MANINIGAFLEGFTGGSLFFEAKRPGVPNSLFVPDEEEEAGAEVSAHLRTVGVR